MSSKERSPQAIYEVQVLGELDRSWETFFSGMAVTLTYTSEQPPITILTGPVADQAALRGLLCKLWDLNLTLVAFRRIEADASTKAGNE